MDRKEKGGSVEWPARSPDLKPLDFFFWVVMKHRVYAQRIRDIEHLKESIKREVVEARVGVGGTRI